MKYLPLFCMLLALVRAPTTRARSPDGSDLPRGADMIQGWQASEGTMKTEGEIEAAICEGITRFE